VAARPPTGFLFRVLTSPRTHCFALALLLTAALTALGVSVLDTYHTRAHYHFDSAGYRYNALLLYQNSKGARLAAAAKLLEQKDTLDLVLRLVLYPRALASFHGHLYVQVPFMVLFFTLALWYVYRRTGTLLYGVAALSVVALFGTLYHPVQGLMDYWKENLAVWLLGGALVSWFLSERGTQRGWGFLCGVLLGLLALQRVVVVVYGTVIFLPLLTHALLQRVRGGGWRKLLGDGLAFGIVPLVVAGFLVLTQAKGIIHYYSVAGYDYATPSVVAKYLWTHPFSASWTFRLGVLAFLAVPAVALMWSGSGRARALTVALWLVVAFPATVIATKAMYHGFSVVLMVLTATAVCRLAPGNLSAPALRAVSVLLLVVAGVGGLVQVRANAAVTEQYAQRNVQYRQVFAELGDVLVNKPAGAGVGFFFDECFALVQMQLYYDHGVRPTNEIKYFSSVHDSYYRASFGDKAPDEIAKYLIAHMELDTGMVAVVPAQAESVARLFPAPVGSAESIPAQVNGRITKHIQASPRWRATRYLSSEVYGPLLVFQLSAKQLTLEEKWGALRFYAPVAGLNFASAVAPAVRQLGCSSPPACPVEWENGVAYQWVMMGARGTAVSVLADHPTEVVLRAGIIPGPSRAGPNRTVVVRQAGAEQRFEFSGEGELRAPLHLRAGLNEIEILSADAADVAPTGADTRPLLFRLRSPHLLLAEAHSEGK
jgi:hypothetical protein